MEVLSDEDSSIAVGGGEKEALSGDEADPNTSTIRPGTQFPEHVKAVLESLYHRGMTGWGARHSGSFDEAVKSTGLNDSQVKVAIWDK